MEAPAPVSAYLHSATMVKAGIYLLARLSPALGDTEAWFTLVGGVGLATTLVGAYLALSTGNMKRMLAYSTISSLGMMALLIGIGSSGAILAAMVFLLAHALYKGALFMIAGALSHETGAQEVDELGGLREKMPVLMVVTLLAALSLAGLGPLLSFIGKELIFESLLEIFRIGPVLSAAAVLFSAVSAAVALNLAIRPFFGPLKPTPHPAHESPLRLWLSPALLAGLGLALGLFPAAVAGTIISPAVSASVGEPQAVKLSLWHGFNLPLALSGVSILLGLSLYGGGAAWRRGAGRLASLLPWGPERGYGALLAGFTGLAARVTGVLQTGRLHDYMMITAATTAGLAGFTLFVRREVFRPLTWPELRFYEAFLALLILAAAFVAVTSSSRLVAVAALGVVGYGVSLIFILFGAPDLAMTQILIETVTLILLVLILYHLPKFSELSGRAARTRDALIALAAGGLMTVLILVANSAEHFPPISEFFIENSVPLAHGRNIVNAILVDFRGLDTFGEITVLSLAAIGVYALLKLRKQSEKGRS
jgi:multicomponent Na+:H+ antiporter subunit A